MRGWLLSIILIITGQPRPVYGQAVVNPVPYSISGSQYLQNFDGLPNTGAFLLTGKGPFSLSASPISAANMAGWQAFMFSGSNANAGFAVATGSSTGNAVYSLGATSSTDRALGSLSSGTGIYAVGFVLTNQTGGPLNHFTVSFTAEQWRKGGSGNKNTWSFRYKTGAITHIDQPNMTDEANLNFSSVITTTGVATLVGNQPLNQQSVSYTVYGISWKAGEQLLLRWDDADETGPDDIMALDDLSFSAGLTAGPPTITAAGSNAVTTSTAELNGLVNDNFSTSIVVFEYDTSGLFTDARSVRPVPDTILAGSGNTGVVMRLSSLIAGKTYYFRIRAQNSLGMVTSAIKDFTTILAPPLVTMLTVSAVATSTAVLSCNIAGESIQEKGIVWSAENNPTTANNKIIAGSGSGSFSQLITGLQQGSAVYARAYAINAGGIAYSDTVRLITQTIITSLMPSTVVKTNAATVNFTLKTAQPLTGLSPQNFSLQADGVTGAFITAVTGNAGNFTITVNTGDHSGMLSLMLASDSGLSLPINNKPFAGTGAYSIDKLAPQVKKINIPDIAMKIGDTIPVTVSLLPEQEVFKMNNGNINGYPLSPLVKKNDSTYVSSFIITAGGDDIDAAAAIPFTISLVDAVGNTNTLSSSINQQNDLLDANKPLIQSMQNPAKGMYKTGDTLNFVFRFSEKITVSNTGIPSITLAIGTRSRVALYIAGDHTDTLLLRYIIAPDDFDNDGIKTTSVITLNNALVRDIAGNTAQLNFTSNLQNDILIDAIAPVISSVQLPANKTYRTGDTLQFVFTFSKGLILTSKNEPPLVKLTIGNTGKDLLFTKQNGAGNLLFDYIIQYGDLDKNGIGIAPSITLNNSRLTDSVGNPANIGFKTASSANIKIDAVSPVFTTTSPETVFVCANGALTIANAFAVTDDEAGELVSWKIKNTPQHGAVSLPAFSVTSTGKNIIPAGIIYKPYPDQNGTDTLVTELTDGINTMQKTIIVFIQPSIQNNHIFSNQLTCEEKLPALLTGSIPAGDNGLYKYGWDMSTDSIHFPPVTGLGDQSNYQPTFLHANTWFRRRASAGACSDTSAPVKITTIKTGFWTGSSNSDWQNKDNWCGGSVPGSTTNVLIPAGTPYQPLINDTASCNELNIANGARLAITGILALTGKIISPNGAIQAGNGKVICNGFSAQELNGDLFEKNILQHLTINNPEGLTLPGDVKLTGVLTLTKGFLQTNGHLLLKPGAAIGPSAAGTTINGNTSIEYLVKGGRRSFYLIGHPFSHSIALQAIRDSLDLTGENGSINGFVTTPGNKPTAFFHDFDKGNDSTGIDAGWTAFTNTNGLAENAWQKYHGIRLLFNGSPGQGMDGTPPGNGSNGTYIPRPVILKIMGDVNTGDQEFLLQRGAYPGYHAVANPYASPIELSRITKGAGIGNYYWIWDPWQGKNGGYTSYPFSSPNSLPALGAFIVKSNDSNKNTLLFTEHCKTQSISDTRPVFQSDDAFFVELRLETDTIFWDRLLLIQIDSARTGTDKNDAEKFTNEDVNFYSLSRDNKKLSVDARPITNESIVPIGLQTNENSSFTIRVAKSKLPSTNTLMLHDKYLGKWLPLETDSAYQFITTNDTLTQGEKRFEISSQRKNTDSFLTTQKLVMKTYPVPAKNTIVVKYASTETGNTAIRIVDLFGNLVKSIPLGMQKQGQVIIPVSTLPSGIYVVEIRCGNDVSMQKIIKQ
jgi:hypothetical protein